MYDFDEVWNEFHNKLLNYIRSRVSDHYDAEDILQNVFLKVFNNLENLDKEEAIKSWIYKITKNTIIDFYKKKKLVSVDPESLYSIKDDVDDINNMNDDISNCIKEMIFSLPDKYQTVYDMYENQEMKHKEIAEKLDISISNSKVRLKRSKELFKRKLVDCCDFEVDKYGNIIDYHSKVKC